MSTLTVTGLEALLGDIGLQTPIPHFAEADVLNKPRDIARSYFADILSSLVGGDPANAYNSIQWPSNIDNGDLAAILPKLSHGADYHALALDLITKFPECPLFIRRPFEEGMHLRMFYQPRTLPRLVLSYINDRKQSYGRDASLGLHHLTSPESGRKRLVIEFSSPNIDSEFQAKHLRSTILGASIASIYGSMGWDVTKINYLGDWGKPLGLLGAGWEKFEPEGQFQADPLRHLFDVYHKTYERFEPEQAAYKKARDEGKDPAELETQELFAERNAFFKRMEDGEEKALAFWKRVREINIDSYNQLYSRLNISFDEYSGESQVSQETMAEVEDILKNKGICEADGPSWIIDLKKFTKKAGREIIRDRTGSSTYMLRDLAAVLDRDRKYSFDKMIYVVATDNKDHFSRLFKILELMDLPDLAGKLEYVSFSGVSQMSKKLGRGHTPDDILDQCQAAMRTSLKENPEKATLLGSTEETVASVGTTALLAQELSARRANDHAFDISHMTSFEHGTGPDLQYWYARLCSVLKTAPDPVELSDEDFASLREDGVTNVLRLLATYPEITNSTYRNLEPVTVMAYLASVTDHLSSCFEGIEESDGITPVQATLFEATRTVLENGMKLVGINPAIH
ncbi:Nucleotidylyl transferase [Rhizodiscina lignyota]|uniref:arginine--tRNA ligase n=1 Tax=Rhizodiscina lignyota TaxID=1504668 RepID=A0A9P4IF82_9PEZI|nr:Nucleotidylyl transferase [Rhizodiscina lignyota]